MKNKYLVKYSLEFLVIVLGVSVSFYLSEISKKRDLKVLSISIQQNLLNEVIEIEKYIKERENAFFSDTKTIIALQNKKFNLDSLRLLNRVTVTLFNYRGFSPPNSVYNSLVSDGNLGLIESSKIKEELSKMHIQHFYHIKSNVEDENIAKKKIVDYFQLNYPKFFLDGQFSEKSENYNIELKKIINTELTLQSFIHEKRVAMILKNGGLKRYNNSLIKIKKLLSDNLLKSKL
ncbi:MAG: Uncharacterised protein [Polaribacter sp. SA4-10]|nr:MAG: Uncharacterised protein [Polaribacter sp. SA4-10]|tara:strand:- start:368 stop:1066 length:699 start_codon:yes stop_codon:yes gene_type:complete